MRTYVYVDGFNLYHGALEGLPFKWLNLWALAETLLPGNQIAKVKYFTARVRGLPHDPDQPTRQQTYLRALGTVPNLHISFGHFLSNDVNLPLADGSGWATVARWEEKGSDVNLATHLVRDAFCGEYDVAMIVSNDSDLAEAITIVRNDTGLPVGFAPPVLRKRPDGSSRRMSNVLKNVAAFRKTIRQSSLRQSQFPNPIEIEGGQIHKPPDW